jgi:[protein-PII] uridylyltransferase
VSPASLEDNLAQLERWGGPGPGREAAVLETVRSFLVAVRADLASRHRAGAGGAEINSRHSDLMDRLLRRLFQLAEAEYFAEGHEASERVAVLAVGGYARREMSIHSDLDLLLLHTGKLTPYTTRIAERLQYWLWDGGLSVGCATRTIDDTVRLAQADNTVFTGILDTRFLAGDPVFFHEFGDALRRRLLPDVSKFVAAQAAALDERHARYGDSLYLLQPNLKEGAGGLRDYHAAIWAMRAVLPTTHGSDDLLHYGLLTESEMDAYSEGLDFLWRIRNELHLLTGRRFDQMSFDHQERIAAALGYTERDDALAVEVFMGDYYRAARTIRSYSTLVLEQCEVRVRPPRRRRIKAKEIEDGFRLVEGKLDIARASHLQEDPLRLLRAFAIAQRRKIPLTRFAQRMVREHLSLIGDTFRSDPAAAELFLGILDAEDRVLATLMEMNEVGLLGAYLPEWDHIVCRWQHVMYHTYTVDVHSIFLVEELRRLWRGKYREEQPELTELMRSIDDRPVLFLGCLLHDIGKGLGDDHSSRGAERTRRCLERIGLEPARIERVVFLVRQHLVMSHVAQRRDLSDSKTLLEFARLVGDRNNLRLLYLLTVADMRASSKTAWTEWKGALLRELYEGSAEVLESGHLDPRRNLETIHARIEARRAGAREILLAADWEGNKAEVALQALPARYFVGHTPRQIGRHLEVLDAFRSSGDLVTRVRTLRGGFSELIVVCPDTPGLYSRVAGTLTARGINVLASNVYTTRDGVALEVYRRATASPKHRPGSPRCSASPTTNRIATR